MLSQIINKYISKLKGNDYQVDPRIPTFYLVKLILERVIMKIRGKLSFIRSGGAPFIGRSVRIKARSKMQIGAGVTIGHWCYIDALSSEGIRFGNNVSVGNHTKIECTGNIQHIGKGLEVGNNVGLGSDNFFGCAGGITIGDDTIIGNFVSFHAENHVHEDLSRPIRLQGVTHQGIRIGKNCWIGAKATILDGADLQDGCIVAAGAVLKAGVYQANGIYGGVPAKLIKFRSTEAI